MTELHVSGLDRFRELYRETLVPAEMLADAMHQLGRAMYSATDAFGDYHEAYDDAVDPDDFSTDPDRWYCRYCGSANHPDALYCGEIVDGRGVAHCGAPRPEDGLELPEELAAINDIPREIGVNVDLSITPTSILERDEFWLTVQGVARATGLDVQLVADDLRSGILRRNKKILANLGLHIEKKHMHGTWDDILMAVHDEATCLFEYSHYLSSSVEQCREKAMRARAVFGSPTGRILDNLGMTIEL